MFSSNSLTTNISFNVGSLHICTTMKTVRKANKDQFLGFSLKKIAKFLRIVSARLTRGQHSPVGGGCGVVATRRDSSGPPGSAPTGTGHHRLLKGKVRYYHIQGTHSNCIFKFPVFPVFSMSDRKFSLCQFT